MKLLSFFKRVFNRVSFQRAAEKVTILGDQLTERQRCLKILEAINTDQFALYHHNGSGLGVVVRVPYHTIDEYTDSLISLTRAMGRNNVVARPDFESLTKEVPLDTFFSSRDGYYIDVEKSVIRFRRIALDMCNRLEQSDVEDTGTIAYYGRIYGPLLRNIRETVTVMAEASLSN